MSHNAIISIDKTISELSSKSYLNLSSKDFFEKDAKKILPFLLKNQVRELLISINEQGVDPYFLNKFILHLKKLSSELNIYISTDYLINDLYKNYLGLNLIQDLYVGLELSHLKSFLDGKEILISNAISSKSADNRVLLIAPLAWSPQFPQLGLAYISASLKEEGHDVDLIDCNIDFFLGDNLSKDEKAKYKNMPAWIDPEIYFSFTKIEADKYIEKLIERIKSNHYKIIGLSVHHSSEIFTIEFLKKLKSVFPDIKTICGGPSTHMPFITKAMKEGYLDLAIKGEGEFIVKEAVKYLKGEDAVLDGCITNNNGVPLEHNSKSLANINDLILPDFSEFKIYDYENYRLPTSLSRGCVAKCSFCFETLYWKKFRIKRPENAVHEVMSLADKYKIRNFSINDSLMNGSHKLLEDFCDQIIKKDFPISFYGYCRIDKKLTFKILEKMSKAGCQSISYGIESGSKKILADMAKGVDKKYILPVLKDTKRANIRVVCCFIVGYPGEGLIDYL